MKKLVVIAFIGSGLFFVSCHKENVRPRECDKNTPTWDFDSLDTRGTKDDGGIGVIDGGTITDPNDDEDGNGKKKGKNN